MKFGPVPAADSVGAILAHSLRVDGRRIAKGTVITDVIARRLTDGGIAEVTVARLEDGELDENEAADLVARAFLDTGCGVEARPAGRGRASLVARAPCLVQVDREALMAANRIDEAITVATVPPGAGVAAGEEVAAVKIITFGVAGAAARQVADGVRAAAPLELHPFRPLRAALVQTANNGFRETIYDKSVEATTTHLAALGASLVETRRTDHNADRVQEALVELENQVDLILLLGASSTVDRRDVVPAALVQAGGEIVHLGMPVDPGNLTMVGRLDKTWVFSLPGSARSPRVHGFDLLLRRIAAGFEITGEDIIALAAGGLLREPLLKPPAPATRREKPAATPPRITALILAAGRSSRMVDRNKLLEEIDGTPLVRRTVNTVAASSVTGIVVVTGHEAERVRHALDGCDVAIVHNPDFADGLSTSLREGLGAVPPETDAVLVCLGDMPDLSAATIDAIVARYRPAERAGIVVPVHDGQRGNPVLFDIAYKPEMTSVSGDTGARQIIRLHPDDVAEVTIDDAGILTDLDTPEAWQDWRRTRDGS